MWIHQQNQQRNTWLSPSLTCLRSIESGVKGIGRHRIVTSTGHNFYKPLRSHHNPRSPEEIERIGVLDIFRRSREAVGVRVPAWTVCAHVARGVGRTCPIGHSDTHERVQRMDSLRGGDNLLCYHQCKIPRGRKGL